MIATSIDAILLYFPLFQLLIGQALITLLRLISYLIPVFNFDNTSMSAMEYICDIAYL